MTTHFPNYFGLDDLGRLSMTGPRGRSPADYVPTDDAPPTPPVPTKPKPKPNGSKPIIEVAACIVAGLILGTAAYWGIGVIYWAVRCFGA